MGRRFRVEPGSLDGAPVRVPLGAEESHHVRVARLRGGSRVVVFDGLGNEAEGVLEIGSEESVWVVDLEPTASQAESHLDVVVLQALPVKLQRLDATVRLCTELGMQALEPLVTEYFYESNAEAYERFTEQFRNSSVLDTVPQESIPSSFRVNLSDPSKYDVIRAAFEQAWEYAHRRRQGGQPLIRHQHVRYRLFEMFRKVEAARSLARRVSMNNAVNPGQLQYAIASKVSHSQRTSH